MSELGSFSGETFNAKMWINHALESRKEGDSVQSQASFLVMKLQLRALELNELLDKLSNQSLLTIPRVMLEVERVKKDASELKTALSVFEREIAYMETSTEHSIRFLTHIDRVKNRLDRCCVGLREAENLASLGSDIEKLLGSDSSDPHVIAQRIGEMRASLEVLTGVPDFETKHRLLLDYQSQLVRLLKPRLIASFKSHSIENTEQIASLFAEIDRMDECLSTYLSCWIEPALHVWSKATSPGGSPDAASAFRTFFDHTLGILDVETKFTRRVFSTHADVLVRLVATLIERTSMGVVLESQCGATDAIARLIAAYDQSVQFAASVRALLKRNESDVSVSVLDAKILAPFRPFQQRYEELESKFIFGKLERILPHEDSFETTLREIDSAVPQVFLLCDSALDHCVKFTNALEAPQLLTVLESSLSQFIERLFRLLAHLRSLSQVDTGASGRRSASATATAAAVGGPGGGGGSGSGRGKSATGGGGGGSGGFFHDWSFFQGALQMLQIVNTFTSRLQSFERVMRHSLVAQRRTHSSSTQPALVDEKIISFFNRIDNVASRLLPTSDQKVMSLNSEVQSFVFDTMFQFVRERLASVPTLREWAAPPPKSGALFSLSPLGYVTQIGEHLLTLPQQLEPFVAEMDGGGGSGSGSGPSSGGSVLDDDNDDEHSRDSDSSVLKNSGGGGGAAESFAAQWLSAVGRSTSSEYLQRIVEIRHVSESGRQQLATDIGYLTNVLSALGLAADPTLQRLQDLLLLSDDDLRTTALGGGGGGSGTSSDAPSSDAAKYGLIVAKMRGIA